MTKTRSRAFKKKKVTRKAPTKVGRKTAYLELLRTMKNAMGLSVAQMAAMTGVKRPNLSAYINGNKKPGLKAIRSALRNLSEWNMCEDKVMHPIAQRRTLAAHSGIYFMYDTSGNCVYLGQAKDLKAEVAARLKSKTLRHGIWRDPKLKRVKYELHHVVKFVTTYRVDSPRLRHNLEALFLRTVINQTQNAKLGKFK